VVVPAKVPPRPVIVDTLDEADVRDNAVDERSVPRLLVMLDIDGPPSTNTPVFDTVA